MRDTALQSLAVGFFDGVHLGHQKILRGANAALTFANHPLSVLAPTKAPQLIMSVDERVAAIRACGVEDVFVLDFTPAVAEIRAENFAAFLGTHFKRRFMSFRCGANWRFGKDGRGDAAFLRQQGFNVEEVLAVDYKGEMISSSRIRTSLVCGALEEANAMLGKAFTVKGECVRGKGLGSQIGFPTFNISLKSPCPKTGIHLPLGVYEVRLKGQKGVANYGLAPTMGDCAWQTPVLEVHVLSNGHEQSHIEAQIGSELSVEMIRFIRPERTFADLDELKKQIILDCKGVSK